MHFNTHIDQDYITAIHYWKYFDNKQENIDQKCFRFKCFLQSLMSLKTDITDGFTERFVRASIFSTDITIMNNSFTVRNRTF